MRKILCGIICLIILFNTGCAYWPESLKGEYYKEEFKEMKEDLDDVTCARKL